MASKNGRDKNRQHVYRRPKDRPGLIPVNCYLCPDCGKWAYQTRGDAETAARQAHPGAVMRFYQCESAPRDRWHYTSMTADQVAQIRARRAAPDDAETGGADQVA